MTFAIALTAVATFLSTATIAILAILVAGIRGEDRAKNLTRAPRTRTLNLAAVAASVLMNVLAAGPGWRNLAI